MKFFTFFVLATLFAATSSCTLDKTDFEAEISKDVTQYFEFKEAVLLTSGDYNISVQALNGTFYKGYNEIRLKITNTQNNQPLIGSQITFLPILTVSDGSTSSCPHRYNLVYNSEGDYYAGYAVFTSVSNPMEIWNLYVSFTENNQLQNADEIIAVEIQSNKNLNMTSFTGNDGDRYFIALVGPQKPSVAENELVAGIYKYNPSTEPSGTFPDPAQFSYTEAEDYTILLDPRMPEPSMGNHSSINNVDLTQRANGLYYGVVNYTMTGNWTLNFILKNQFGEVIKGTQVSTEFTPGIEGARSELHIDILF